jgi:hypothetical protein
MCAVKNSIFSVFPSGLINNRRIFFDGNEKNDVKRRKSEGIQQNDRHLKALLELVLAAYNQSLVR